ncbi:MAG: gliding motility-associated C-terminal domain-containing protein, partial [Saprospiraceae bacterium]
YPATATATVYPLPQPELGRDTVVCADDNYPLLVLQPGVFTTYRWQDQSTAANFPVLDGGVYAVHVEDEHGCMAGDTIGVRAICPSKYYVPNVFSPNDDGENDFFEIFSKDLLALQLSIYDRWGELLFQSNTLDARWDGRVRGKAVAPGVYIWVARLEGYRKDGSTYSTVEKGSVTVVR